jgi:uncharacterized tellurite resistance protein B-like protein
MLRSLKELFDNLTAPATDPPQAWHAPQLAAAVLLAEVMRAAGHGQSERQAVLQALRRTFTLADDAGERLLARAQAETQQLYDYHRFTSVLNDSFTQPQKIELVEALWSVAYADQRVQADENHAISKIAGLLHVTHGEYIGAKLRAKEAAEDTA